MENINLEGILNTLIFISVGCFAIFRGTAKWRRKRAMKKLAYELNCDYTPQSDSLLTVFGKFLTLQDGYRPSLTSILTRNEGDQKIVICDLTYVRYDRLKNMVKGAYRHRTFIAITQPGMTLPHFYVRPETNMDKMREMFSGPLEAFEQFKEGIHVGTGERFTELGEHINRPPAFNAWINKDEIKLPHARQFSDNHWIKGNDREATLNFLSGSIIKSIEADPGLIWEGFESTFILSQTTNHIHHKDIGRCINVAQKFIQTALAASKSHSAQ